MQLKLEGGLIFVVIQVNSTDDIYTKTIITLKQPYKMNTPKAIQVLHH